ncbi:biotin-dependent carboxyltransferase family protein [Pseudomonas sp. LB3P38]|uniref:5-oxoprolinase subunit C family protein n=1 Tax=Pseudomonas lyxosi TaxID=3398358 RepID=UPI0039EFA3DA
MIEVLTTGAPNSIQDLGRFGHLDIGVSHCGAMDRPALALGNALLGNATSDAGLEVVMFPFKLRFQERCRFALTGADCGATIAGCPIPPNWVSTAHAGQTLVLERPLKGARAYLSFEGGVDVPPLMGSRSTDLKCAFGGLEGRGLRRGDRLSLGSRPTVIGVSGFGAIPGYLSANEGDVSLRVLRAAEHDFFTKDSLKSFYATAWELTQEANRMGYRLSGIGLSLKHPVELFSHGILSGTVQVPPSGQPIIQMADANTCGGYPKIATVIEADLWRLAQSPSGTKFRFVETDHLEAIEAMRKIEQQLEEVRIASRRLSFKS